MSGSPSRLELVVIGAGPAYTDRADASGAAYLVLSEGAALLLDLGQGSFPRLFAQREPSSLTAIAISHLHPDHFIDLVSLRHYLRYHCRPSRRLPVLAPRGLADRIDALHATPGFTAEALDVSVLGAGARRVGDFELETRLVTHTDESYAMRISVRGLETGLVYSGDCGRADDLVPLIRPGDALLSEVSFGPGPVEPGAQHLDGPAVGRVAAAARVGRVLLTHLQMGFDPDATVATVHDAGFAGPVEFVWPGSRVDLDASGQASGSRD